MKKNKQNNRVEDDSFKSALDTLKEDSPEKIINDIKKETAISPNGSAVFILDSSAMVEMINQTQIGKELLDKIKTVKDSGVQFLCITLLSSFYRAIYLAKQESNIQAVQKLIYVCEIFCDDANFMNEEETTDALLDFVKILNAHGRPMKF